MNSRVAFITNLCPYYRRPLFERLSRLLDVTFFFFSDGRESYLGSAVQHELGNFTVKEVRRTRIAGQPLLIGLEKELNRANYDVVIKCLNGRLMMPYTYTLARRRGLPFVLWTGMWHHPRTLAHAITRPMVEHIYRHSDAIVTYGSHVSRFVESVPGVAPDKVHVAGQAIEASRFAKVSRDPHQPPVVLFVGRLTEEKGIYSLIKAFRELTPTHAKLRIVGAGPDEAALRDFAAASDGVEFVGALSQGDIPREFSRARCLVLPSVTTRTFREPWGLVINEAMASGLPVVATDAVGAAAGGLVMHRQNGLVVPEGDPKALASGIKRLIEDPTLSQRMGQKAREDVAAFSYDRMARAFVGSVRHALSATRDRSGHRTRG